MPKSRQALIDPNTTPYYHCVSRCVRRAFLCGEDAVSGRSFEHRRDWIEERLLQLTEHFAIRVCAYAVMSNHTHAVLFIDQESASHWSQEEVVERWHGLFSGTTLSQRFLGGDTLIAEEQMHLQDLTEQWRNRLTSVSWFMRCLNEHIARLANKEDECTGRFWEGRFKSQALLDEAALAACMAYVDLNPIRAKIAVTPETSDFTSIQRRIRAQNRDNPSQPSALMPFTGNQRDPMPSGLPFRLEDYLNLVDLTGRVLLSDKPGLIKVDTPPILERLKIEPQSWLLLASEFEIRFVNLVGRIEQVKRACTMLNQHWARGTRNCKQLFAS